MPAIPIVIGALAVSAGAAGTAALVAGTLTLATVAAGATLLGGVMMIAGTIKGGAEGAKWASIGSTLATVGSLGMNFTATTSAAADTAAHEAAVANSTTGNFVDAAAAPTAASTAGSDVATSLMSPPSMANIGDGSMLVNPLNSGSSSALAASDTLNTGASMTAPVIDSSGTSLTAPESIASDAAARGAATNSIPTTAQPGAGYNWDTAAGKWRPPSSSLTSNNNMMTLLGGTMNGYSQGQMTQAQIDAMKELQTQRIQADQARVSGTQYNPLLTASNK